jgi:hypothetical protein
MIYDFTFRCSTGSTWFPLWNIPGFLSVSMLEDSWALLGFDVAIGGLPLARGLFVRETGL